MKPIIRMRRGIWVCSRRVGTVCIYPMGHGYTPAEAFRDWHEQAGQAQWAIRGIA